MNTRLLEEKFQRRHSDNMLRRLPVPNETPRLRWVLLAVAVVIALVGMVLR